MRGSRLLRGGGALAALAALFWAGARFKSFGSLKDLAAQRKLSTLEKETLPRHIQAMVSLGASPGQSGLESAGSKVLYDLNVLRETKHALAENERSAERRSLRKNIAALQDSIRKSGRGDGPTSAPQAGPEILRARKAIAEERAELSELEKPSKFYALADDIAARQDEIQTLLHWAASPGIGPFAERKILIDQKAIGAEERYLERLTALARRNVLRARGASPVPLDGRAIVSDAMRYLGSFDGNVVQDVFADFGVDLPAHPRQQSRVGAAVPDLAQAAPGDLVFYAGPKGGISSLRRAGIYIGKGQAIGAPRPGGQVNMEPVGSPAIIRRVARPGSKP